MIVQDSSSRISILLPDLHVGGAERVGINLANDFVARGMQVDMVLMSAEGELLHALDSRVQVIDLRARRIRESIAPLRRYFSAARPQGMIVNMWPLTIAALVARRQARLPIRTVLVEHTSWSIDENSQDFLKRLLVKATMRAFYRNADAVVAVSQGAANDLAQFSGLRPSSITVIYNPIVIQSVGKDVSPPLAEEWWKGNHKRVLAVGSLKVIKGYPILVHAFARLCKRIDAKLLILGEGSERSSLEELICRLGLADRVYMPGLVQDPAPYFAHANLHVLSSYGEGFGNVIVEALEHGTPVVSSDCPSGPREILVDGKFGRLVPVGEINLLASEMEEALLSEHDPAALKHRAQDFTVGKAADAYLHLLFPERSGTEGRHLKWS